MYKTVLNLSWNFIFLLSECSSCSFPHFPVFLTSFTFLHFLSPPPKYPHALNGGVIPFWKDYFLHYFCESSTYVCVHVLYFCDTKMSVIILKPHGIIWLHFITNNIIEKYQLILMALLFFILYFDFYLSCINFVFLL